MGTFITWESYSCPSSFSFLPFIAITIYNYNLLIWRTYYVSSSPSYLTHICILKSHMHAYIQIYTHVYICIQSHAYIQSHMYICKHVHITTCTVSNTYASIYTITYSTQSHTHMKALIHNHIHNYIDTQ